MFRLIDLLPKNSPSSIAELEITSLTQDSRQAGPGALFFAVQGTSRDGHEFIESLPKAAAFVVNSGHSLLAALKKKPELQNRLIEVPDTRRALAEAACRFYGEPSRRLAVCGVTGTNGKTTSTYLLEALLQEWSMRPAVIGTVENRFGTKKFTATHTTPDAVELQRLLHQFLKEGATAVAMEVSSHALDQWRVGGMHFEAALFTNLTQDHLDYHGTLENYYSAKARLFLEYPVKVRAVHADDQFGERLVSECLQRGLNVITFGRRGCNVNYENLHLTSAGISGDLLITVKGTTQKLHVNSPLLGSFNAQNLAGVVAVGVGMGMPFAKISSALAHAKQVPGRMESIANDRGITVVVDYAHTPDALENVLKTARALCTKKLFCVFGCGGDRDAGKRPVMAATAEKLADEIYLTSDNPRTEDPHKIIADVSKGLTRPQNAHIVPDRRAAIGAAIKAMNKGDMLIIAGKGHEDYQIIGTTKLPFDDRAVAAENLK